MSPPTPTHLLVCEQILGAGPGPGPGVYMCVCAYYITSAGEQPCGHAFKNSMSCCSRVSTQQLMVATQVSHQSLSGHHGSDCDRHSRDHAIHTVAVAL